MLMCEKVSHKDLIGSSPLFPCIILLGQSKGKIQVYAP